MTDEATRAEWRRESRKEIVRERDFAYYCFRVYKYELGQIGNEMGMEIVPNEGTPEDYFKEWKECSEPALSKALMFTREAYDRYRRAEAKLEAFDRAAAEQQAA